MPSPIEIEDSKVGPATVGRKAVQEMTPAERDDLRRQITDQAATAKGPPGRLPLQQMPADQRRLGQFGEGRAAAGDLAFAPRAGVPDAGQFARGKAAEPQPSGPAFYSSQQPLRLAKPGESGAGTDRGRDLVEAAGRLSEPVGRFLSSVQQFDKSVGRFEKAIDRIPEEISLRGEQQLTLRIDGAEVLAKLTPGLLKTIEDKAKAEIEKAITRLKEG